jgi:hypothetical protein
MSGDLILGSKMRLRMLRGSIQNVVLVWVNNLGVSWLGSICRLIARTLIHDLSRHKMTSWKGLILTTSPWWYILEGFLINLYWRFEVGSTLKSSVWVIWRAYRALRGHILFLEVLKRLMGVRSYRRLWSLLNDGTHRVIRWIMACLGNRPLPRSQLRRHNFIPFLVNGNLRTIISVWSLACLASIVLLVTTQYFTSHLYCILKAQIFSRTDGQDKAILH